MRVGFVQTNPKIMWVQENLIRAEKMILPLKADLLVLPELFTTGYHFKNRKEVSSVAESFKSGTTVKRLQALARKKNCAIVAGLAEKEGPKLYNSAAFITPNRVETYRKTHLFGREKLFFTPGNTGFRVFKWKSVNIGVMVCFDWFFPEAARTLALKGAQIIAHPANLVLPYCPEAMKTRCLENRVYAVTCDRVGGERGLKFIGQSQIVDPWGKILFRASSTRAETKIVSIDPAQAQSKQLNRFNHLFKDRKPVFYR